MVCPHCGSEAGSQSFCPSCSRLVNSPLLGMHRELAASRGKTYGAEAIAAAAATRARDLAAARSPRGPAPGTGASAATDTADRGAVSEAMRKALDRRERKSKRKGDEGDGGASSAALRAAHSTATHSIEDTSAPPPLPQTKPVAVDPTLDRFPRPMSVTVLALLNGLAAVVLLGLAGSLWDGEQLRPVVRETLPAYVAGVVGVIHALAALGLWTMRPFGRGFQKLLAFGWLFLVPFGTVYALVLFAFFGSTGMTLLFSGRAPRSMKAAEIEAARKTLKLAPVMAIVLFVLAILPALAMASFASSMLPTLIDMAVSARESLGGSTAAETPPPVADPDAQAVADVDAVMQAQAAYASLGGGLYDRLECVVTPAACLGTADPRTAAVLLDGRFTQPERNGYLFRLVLGRRPEVRPDGASATGVDAYAYVATSVAGGGLAICGDSTGTLLRLDPDVAVSLKTAKCPSPEE